MISKWSGIITCLSPLSHNDDINLGTDTKYRRMKMQTQDGIEDIPIYSGNAYRGILRRIAAADFLEKIEASKISDALYYTYFAGGALQKGSSQGGIEVGMKREVRTNIPFLSLFGTAYQNQVMPGKLNVGIGIPISRETEIFTGIQSEKSIWDIMVEIFYTRRDDLEDKETEQKEQMKYTVECLSAGTTLQHEFTLDNASDIELSCFGAIMVKLNEDPVLGGKSSVGHGKVRLEYAQEWPDPDEYYSYLDKNKSEIQKFVKQMDGNL